MEIYLLCSLLNFSLQDDYKKFEYGGFTLLPKNPTFTTPVFIKELTEQAGKINMQQFEGSPFYMSRTIVNEVDYKQLLIMTNNSFSRLNFLTNFIWFVKDTSVDVSVIYSFYKDNPRICTKRKGLPFSNSEGNFIDSIITNEDLDKAAEVHAKILELQAPFKDKSPEISVIEKTMYTENKFFYKDYNDSNRIQRSIDFLSMARSNSYLPLKISLYIASVEALFTTDNSEVTFKVCQRVALYLGGNSTEKHANFDIVKSAYAIRSAFFHGSPLQKSNNSRDKLAIISKNIDSVLRKVLNNVVLKDSDMFISNSDEKLGALFLKLSFQDK